MNFKLARRIRSLRCEDPIHDWKIISEIIAEEFPEEDVTSGDQFEGMLLCKEAAEYLSEDWD